MEMTKRNLACASMLVAVAIVSSFFVGGYLATGNWNPWGQRHYYENLNVNFGYCVTGSQNYCSATHNVVFDSGMAWMNQVEQASTGSVTNGCFVSSTCGESYISLSNSAVTFAHGDATYGSTNGNCAAQEGGSELSANGLARTSSSASSTLLSYTGVSGATSTVVHTFTATASQAVQDACLTSYGTISSTNNIELAAASFTQVTLQNTDTIQITWTLTWTWS